MQYSHPRHWKQIWTKSHNILSSFFSPICAHQDSGAVQQFI